MRFNVIRSTRAVLLGIALLATAAQAQVKLEISGANFRPLPVAIPKAQTVGQVPASAVASFDDALMLDASAAGIFQVLDRKSYLADPSEGVTAGPLTSIWLMMRRTPARFRIARSASVR